MSNEVSTGTAPNIITPYDDKNHKGLASGNMNAGTVHIESERAIAEAQGQMAIAKRFPRDLNAAYAELMDVCKLPAMANVAFYNLPQGGKTVTGPTIRLAEQIASSCGHFEWGHRELGRIEAGPGKDDFGRSEVEVYAWDKQKNNRSIRQITVLHVLDTRDGPRKLRDQRDIDNKIANVASKQMRGRLLALLPKWIIEACTEECKKTIGGNNDVPVSVRIRNMTQAFAKIGVTATHLERFLGRSLDDFLVDDIVELTGVFNAIRDGRATATDYFDAKSETTPQIADPAAKPAANQNSQQEANQEKPASTAQVQEPAPTSGRRRSAAKPAPAPAPAEQPASEAKQEQAAPEPEAAKEPETQQPPEDNNPPPADEDLEGLFGGDETPEGDDSDPF